MIEDIPAAYFCEFNKEIDLGESSTIPVVLNVKQIYVNGQSHNPRVNVVDII